MALFNVFVGGTCQGCRFICTRRAGMKKIVEHDPGNPQRTVITVKPYMEKYCQRTNQTITDNSPACRHWGKY